MRRRPFTPDEDAFLIAHYPTTTLKDMAVHLDRGWTRIQQRINILIRRGHLERRQRCYNPPWTQTEIEYLADHWGLKPDAEVARKLGRTVDACKVYATRRLRLARSDNFYTSRQVARIFGVNSHVVIRWIEAGVLAGKPSPVACGSRHRWRIDDPALQRFVKRFPYHYDRTRIERNSYWRNLAERVRAADPWLTVPEAAAIVGIHPHTLVRYLREGRLEAVKTWGAGNHGAYRIRRSVAEAFERPTWGTSGRKLGPRRRPSRIVYARLVDGRITVYDEAA